MNPPIPCIWTGDAFVPERGYLARARDTYGQGEAVTLAPYEPRSERSHDHFFVLLNELWRTLPERLSHRFPTADSLRHWALCEAGFCDVETFVAPSKAAAPRFAAFLSAGARPGVQLVVQDASIIRLTPHSQSMRAMGAKRFQESKTAVLEIVADLIGVSVSALQQARAA